MEDDIKKDLEEIKRAVRTLDGCLDYLSQRVAWNETCFKQVQDSGVMKMAEVTRQVMLDHKKLQSQFTMLTLRVKAALGQQDGDGDQGDQSPPPAATLTRKFGR